MNIRIIGIDLAITAKHKAIILDPASNQFVSKQISFRSLPEEIDRLLQRARDGAGAEPHLVAIMEATGMAWYPVGCYLHQQGVVVYRVNGQKTKDLRRVLWKHAGSDHIDSRVLARLYFLAPDRLERWTPTSGDQLTLQRACRADARWREMDTAIQNRLQAYDQWAWSSLQRIVPAVARDWMRQNWYNPWRVQAAGVSQLAAAWKVVSPEKEIDVEWIPAWIGRAQQMTTLFGSEKRVGYDDLQSVITHNLSLREQCRRERDRLQNEKIQPLYLQLYPDRFLESLPGVGISSAATYMAFIHNISRFSLIERFRKWCGIVPRSKQSGEAEAKGMSITKAGPNLIKSTLFLNAEVARQWDGQIAVIYHTQMVDYGKHHTQAVCACATHLANRIYAVLKEQRPYQLRDLHGNPISKEESRTLCLQYRVPDEIRKRNNKRYRRNRAEKRTEKRYQRKQKRG